MNLLTKQKQIHRLRERTYGCRGEEGWREQIGSLGWTCTHCWFKMANHCLIHVNVWQKSLQYCKVISLQLIKINEKKKNKIKWITTKDLLYSTWNSAQCYVGAWMEGEFGGEWYMCTYGWVPWLFTWNYHNIVNRLYSIQNKKFISSGELYIYIFTFWSILIYYYHNLL